MPNSIVLSEIQLRDNGYRKVVAIADLPSGIIKKDQEVLAFHKMRILIELGSPGVFTYFDIDSGIFDYYFRPILPSEPIVIPVE